MSAAGILQSQMLLGAIALMMAALAIRLDAETRETPRDHLIIAGGALLAFALVFKAVDVLHSMTMTRWSSVCGAIGLLAFLAAEARVALRTRRVRKGDAA